MPLTSAFRKKATPSATTDGSTNGARQRASAGRSDGHDDAGMSPGTPQSTFPGAVDDPLPASEYGRKISWSADVVPIPHNPKVKVTDYVPSNPGGRRRSSLQIGTNATIRSGWVGTITRRKQKLQLELRKRGWDLNRILLRTLAGVVLTTLLIRYLASATNDMSPNSGPRKLSYGRGAAKNGKYVDETESWAGQAPEGGVHQFGSDGWLRSRVGKNGKGGRHPIWDLMEDADHKYENMVKHQPQSLQGLIKQYKDIYGRMPPRHFDLLAPHLVSSLPYSPLASPNPFHMYFAIPPALLHKRQDATESNYDSLDFHHDGPTDAGKLVIEIQNGQVRINWPWNGKGWDGSAIPGDDAGLEDRISRWLHRAEWRGILTDMKIAVNQEELNPQLIPAEYIAAAMKLAKSGNYELDQGERRDRTNHNNWALGCNADSALVKGQAGSFGAALGRGKGIYTPSFIHSPPKAASYCLHPALAPYSPALAIQPEPVEVHTRPVPQLTSRTGLSGLASDILVLGVGHKPRSELPFGGVPWDQKHGQGVFWRGASPEFDDPLSPTNAKLSSALRLALLPSMPIDNYSFPSTLIAPLNVVDASLGTSAARKHGKKQYNFKVDQSERITSELWTRGSFLDVAFTGHSLACDDLPGCDGLSKRVRFDNDWRNKARQKFVMVLDAEDPRDAFESGSLVLYTSATGMSAWQTKAIPWRDYIPVSPDFSDLPSILSFLRANDDQAARIANNGRVFALKVLSEDAYDSSIIGALLEWSRIWSDSRPLMDLEPISF